MAVSGISSSSVGSSQQASEQQQLRQELMQLARSINSGDLTGAQKAYDALSQSQTGSDSNNPLSQALGQIGQALQSGDLTGAQKALDGMKQALQGAHRGHHRHHKPDTVPPDAASPSQTSSAAVAPGVGGVLDTTA
ncbi:MAG: hypothetical protein AB1490_04035 [Pseudomonadota bacterium]